MLKSDAKQAASVAVVQSENDEETKSEEPVAVRYLFISDGKPPKRLKHQFKNLVVFSKAKFTNRSPADLVGLGCSDLWVNLGDDNGRKWLERYLPASEHKVIALYSNKKSKWIMDVEKFASTTCKSSILDNIESLTFKEMGDILEAGLLRIHKSPNIISRMLSCGNLIAKSKK